MQRIYKASDITEAHIVAGMLQAHGIEAHVGGHYLQGGVGDLAALDFAVVYIDDDDAELARTVIAEYEHNDTPPDNNDPGRTARKQSRADGAVILVLAAIVLLVFFWSLAT